MKTILNFAFETGDSSCIYYQVYIIVKSDNYLDYGGIEDSISSYMEAVSTSDMEYENIVEEIMNESGLSWEFMGTTIPESKAINTFWI